MGSNPVGRTKMNDPTQFEQVDETCRSGRVILHLKSLGMTAFLKISRQSEYETLKFKPLQIGVENAKVWRFEHRCLIWRFCKSFLPSGMASDFSMFDAAFWYYKTQYRKRHWLEMLYRKDNPFGRVLLFSARRKMILQLRYHAACRVMKMTSIHYSSYSVMPRKRPQIFLSKRIDLSNSASVYTLGESGWSILFRM